MRTSGRKRRSFGHRRHACHFKDPFRPGLHAGAGGLQLGPWNQHQWNAERSRGHDDAALAAFKLGRRDQVERRRRDAGTGERIATR